MKILVVFSHPKRESLNGEFLNKTLKGLMSLFSFIPSGGGGRLLCFQVILTNFLPLVLLMKMFPAG
jgi:hypothetical protein